MTKKGTMFLVVTLFFLIVLLFFVTEEYHLLQATQTREIELLSEISVPLGTLQQGILLKKDGYYSSNHAEIIHFDTQWRVSRRIIIEIDKMSRLHIGILSKERNGYLVAGIIDLDSYERRESNTRIVKINPIDFHIEQVINFSEHSKYIDAFIIYKNEYWVSYKNFISVYAESDPGVLNRLRRYKILTGTSQGIRIKGSKLYVIPENNLMRVRGMPNGIYAYTLDALVPYDESLLNSVTAFVESVASSINYRFPVDLFNRYFVSGMNMPDVVWEFGFPENDPDNEGFDFDPNFDRMIWVSDVNGDTARSILLK
jgi:hypothetical protein